MPDYQRCQIQKGNSSIAPNPSQIQSMESGSKHSYMFQVSALLRKRKCHTAIKVGVPNLETDLFTNANKLCPSCDTQKAQAGKLLGNVHMCPSQCPICACPVYKLGHSLYTGATAWTLLVHYTGTAWTLLVH